MELRPCFSQLWSEEDGRYIDSDERIGYVAVNHRGEAIAYGETREETFENALEAEWGASRSEEDRASGVAVAR